MLTKIFHFFRSICFSNPDSAEIIIFDDTHSDLVRDVLPENYSVDVFNTRPVQIRLTALILLNFILNLKLFSFSYIKTSKRSIFYKVGWQLLCIYIKADLMSRKPKALVTFIDNCSKFAWLSENLDEVPCIGIQNGFRLSYAANTEDSYYCQHLFCFGEREIIDFPKLGYKVDHFYPVGSLLLSNNLDDRTIYDKPVYDFLIVSCWRGNIGFAQDVVDSMEAMRIMDKMLAEYQKNHNLKAAVILRSERDSDDWVMPEIGMSEEDYYTYIYGDSIEIIDVNFAERNIYPVMQNAGLIIAGFSTTCLIEAYAMGKKVLYANFCGTDKYHVDFKSDIVFQGSGNDYVQFERRLDNLLSCSHETYVTEHKDLMNYYIYMPYSGCKREGIKKKINDIVTLSVT